MKSKVPAILVFKVSVSLICQFNDSDTALHNVVEWKLGNAIWCHHNPSEVPYYGTVVYAIFKMVTLSDTKKEVNITLKHYLYKQLQI